MKPATSSRTQPHARFTARAADLRSASMRRRGLVIGALVIAALLVWLVVFSPVFAVRSVEVTGADKGLSSSVRNVADDVVGQPVVRTDTAVVQQRVENIPEVSSAQVTRSLLGTVSIAVRPRIAVVVVDNGQTRRLVDAQGTAFAAATKDTAKGLPVVTLKGPGANVKDVAQVATVMGAIPAQDRDQVTDVRLSSIGHITFTIGGLKVAWGDSSDSKVKAKSLATMRPIAKKDDGSLLDLRTPKRPVLT
ncbi:cell division protein FtsQ/DivIB [Demetria terragena]|uniref:cell division protein FtsQ/DivIB n=1 Tax=Demetria terragena TaxID=63959 RepID=UPI00035DE187|nr:FtsQ-type POTRA domain-containing protein [Demetria terragena]